MSTVALNNLLTYILSLRLSKGNKQWLAERLMESNESHSSQVSKAKMKFPKIDLSEPLSDEVLSMSCSDVPSDFDYNAERDKMYSEWAR